MPLKKFNGKREGVKSGSFMVIATLVTFIIRPMEGKRSALSFL
jgi:hypothetical protein